MAIVTNSLKSDIIVNGSETERGLYYVRNK